MGVVLDSTGPVGGISLEGAQHDGASTPPSAGARPMRAWSLSGDGAPSRLPVRAIAAMPLGRLDAETSANIGVIHGGVATNIVADTCHIEGECRSHDEARLAEVSGAIVDAVQRAAAETGVDVDVDSVSRIPGLLPHRPVTGRCAWRRQPSRPWARAQDHDGRRRF